MTTITIDRATVEQALEALKRLIVGSEYEEAIEAEQAITALRDALAQQDEPAQEPVAWRCACGANLYLDEYGHPASRAVPVSYGQTLEEAMRETREKAQAYEAGWKAALAQRAEYEAGWKAAPAQRAEPVGKTCTYKCEAWPECGCAPPKAEPVEPVAWRFKPMIGSPWSLSDDGYYISCKRDKGYIVEPLYAAPPQRKPLTEEEIESCRQQGYAHAGLGAPFDFGKAARAVERAHGIKGELK